MRPQSIQKCVCSCARSFAFQTAAIDFVALPAVALFEKSSLELPTFEVPENVNNTLFRVGFCI